MKTQFRRFLILAAAIAALFVLAPRGKEQPRAAANLQISAAQFEQYIRDWSEPEGYFDSDNFISNETSYLHVMDDLHARSRPGGAYVGVGPDQNFTYIAHTRPTLV